MAYRAMEPFVVQALDVVSPTQEHQLGMVVRGIDPTYGIGEFVYAKGVANCVYGSWVIVNEDDWSTTLLAADASGRVAIAMGALVANTFGWFQVSGKAVGKALAGYVDNALVYATATAGSVDDAVVSGDRVKGAKGASAVGTPSAGLAEFELQDPWADDGAAA